ncbi:MAG: hypothetical protein IPJ22_02940 [Bacteroidetes bacterium]|nr:hypothetical protein [Bacteroidota bacterium]
MFVKDKFGDSGLTGICIVKRDNQDPKKAIVDTLLMSCRIIGRNIEFAFLNHIIEDLLGNGYETILAEYIPTKKNEQVEKFYEKAGLYLVSESEKNKKYLLNIANFEPKILNYIKINSLK